MQKIKEFFNDILQIVTSTYDVVSGLATFVAAVASWFGFRAIVVLISILLFFKLLQILNPISRLWNLILAAVITATLWLMWNQSYYHEYRLVAVIQTFGFLGAHVLVVYAVQRIIYSTGIYFKKKLPWLRKNIFEKEQTLDIYEEIDELSMQLKKMIRHGRFSEAEALTLNLHHDIQAFRDRLNKKAGKPPAEDA